MTIRKRLSLVLLGLTLFLLLAVTLLQYFEMRRVLEREVLDRLHILTDLKSDQVIDLFNGLKADIAVISGDEHIRRTMPLLSQFSDTPTSSDSKKRQEYQNAVLELDLRMKRRLSVKRGDILLVDQNGRLVYVDNPDHRSRDMKEGPKGPWQKTIEGGKIEFTLSDLFRLPGEAPQFAFYAAGPIYGVDGRFRGTVVIQAGAEPLFLLFQKYSGLGQSGETELVAQEAGLALVLNPLRHDPDAALTRSIRLGEQKDIPSQQAVLGRAGAGRFTDYRGVETVAVFRPLPVAGKQWGIVSKIDWDEATLPIERLSYLLALLVGVSAVVTIFVVLKIVHFLVTPILLLQAGAKRLGEGDLNYRIGLTRSDELGELAEAFDQMAISLAASNAELSAFSYSVSHDLRAPLRAIAGFAAILAEDHESQLNADARRCLDVIQANVKQMGQLIDDLLQFSRLGRQTITVSPVDMNELARLVVEKQKQFEPDRNIQIEIRPLPEALGDRVLLHQVLVNLISNAIKYTRTKPIAIIEVGCEEEGDQSHYYVKDNGAGFDMQFVDKLFGVFQRLHSAEEFEGTGIGLALVQRIIHRHGGRVWAYGRVGEGATFYFTLPK